MQNGAVHGEDGERHPTEADGLEAPLCQNFLGAGNKPNSCGSGVCRRGGGLPATAALSLRVGGVHTHPPQAASGGGGTCGGVPHREVMSSWKWRPQTLLTV